MRLRLALLLALAACDKSPEAPVFLDAPAPVVPLPPCTPASGSKVSMRRLGDRVIGGATLAAAPTGDPRLFVLEQAGGIRIFEHERLKPTPFLDLSRDAGGPVVTGGEMGLLGIAFHPRYADNGQFFVFYTTANPTRGEDPFFNVVARYTVSADPNIANPTGKIVLAIPDPYSNHNGGMIEFGADGYLYIATGDGGSAGDPRRNGQNPDALLGKILRIDVDHEADGKPYAIPADNPFAAGGGAPEVFILGARNPWRWSFDRGTGDMWIGDVGQGVIEELDVLRAGAQAGVNLGWSAYEGMTCCAAQPDKCAQSAPQQACDDAGKTVPLDSRTHAAGWNAIIGGQVYRGTCFPDLTGWYFYTDNSHSSLAKARLRDDNTLEIVDLPGAFPLSPSSLHADGKGELWETDTSGYVYRLEATP